MLASLAALILTQTAPPPELFCFTSFGAGDRYGFLNLRVTGDYRPLAMDLALADRDGWTKAQIVFDPDDRAARPLLSSIFFVVRYTAKPVFPLTLRAYADGQLRWQKPILVPFWPTLLPGSTKLGTGDYVARADDGRAVPLPREFTVVLTDAKGREVGTLRYPMLDDALQAALSKTLADTETAYRQRQCSPPPPLID